MAAALTRGLPTSVARLLDIEAPRLSASDADTAAFYSINNCLPGLRGISFGNFLIKQVIGELRAERLRLRRFVTLSPIPGFRNWLQSRPELGQLEGGADDATGGKSRIEDSSWVQQERLAQELKPLLMARCAEYLLQSRSDGNQLDPVAAFHLRNGASVARINWLADMSPKGIGQSFGLMVNYMYRLTDIELNHETFVKGGKVAASAEVRALLKSRR